MLTGPFFAWEAVVCIPLNVQQQFPRYFFNSLKIRCSSMETKTDMIFVLIFVYVKPDQ